MAPLPRLPLPDATWGPSPRLRELAALVAPWGLELRAWVGHAGPGQVLPHWQLARPTDRVPQPRDQWRRCPPVASALSSSPTISALTPWLTTWAQEEPEVRALVLQLLGILLVMGPTMEGGAANQWADVPFRPESHPFGPRRSIAESLRRILPTHDPVETGSWATLQMQIGAHPDLWAPLRDFFVRSFHSTPTPVFPDPAEDPESDDWGAPTWVHLGASLAGLFHLDAISLQAAPDAPVPRPAIFRNAHDGATWDVLSAIPDLGAPAGRRVVEQWLDAPHDRSVHCTQGHNDHALLLALARWTLQVPDAPAWSPDEVQRAKAVLLSEDRHARETIVRVLAHRSSPSAP